MSQQDNKRPSFFSPTLGAKLAVSMFFIALVPLVFAGYFSFLSSSQMLIDSALRELEAKVETRAQSLTIELNTIASNVLFLASTPPIQGILRADANGGVDPIDDSNKTEWIERLQAIFVEFEKTNSSYTQIRFIDEFGQEIVRVDRKDDDAHVISDDQLQSKAGRYYFQETMQKQSGEIYVSRLDLNREGNPPEVQVPHTPVIRYATPVFSEQTGEQKGAVVTNILARPFLDILDIGLRSNIDRMRLSVDTFLIDAKTGYYFLHPDKTKEWGAPHDLNTGHAIQNDFPQSVSLLLQSPISGSVDLPELGQVLAYHPVYPDKANQDTFWMLFELIPRDEVLAPVSRLRDFIVSTGLAFSIFVIIFALIFSQRMSSPLQKLAAQARAISQGNYLARTRLHRRDEIGLLAKMFNAMSDTILASQVDLESRVDQKTKELDDKLVESTQSRKAVLNILEDVEEQKKTLEDAQRATLNLLHDINEEKDKVGQEKEKIDAILHSIGDGVFVIDADGTVFMYNTAAAQITGFSASQILGKKYTKKLCFVNEKTREPEDVFITSAMQSGEKKEVPLHSSLVRKNGNTVPIAATAAPLRDSHGEIVGVVVVFRDISKEAAIDRAKTEFVSLASHQLRTPLSTINWYAEMLIAGDVGDLSEDQMMYLKEIYKGNQRMVALVNALLNVSRLELGTFSVDPKDMDLVAELKSVVKELDPQITQREITFKASYGKVPSMLADPDLLRIIFHNLLTNAIKYTNPGGTVSVSLEPKKSSVLFTVKDTGFGIPQEQQDRIFTKLFRADNVKERDTTGTGLGLYIIKSILDHVGGKIWFESEEEKGTTFYVELPKEGMIKREGTKKLDS